MSGKIRWTASKIMRCRLIPRSPTRSHLGKRIWLRVEVRVGVGVGVSVRVGVRVSMS